MHDLVHVRSFAETALRGTVAAAADATGYTPPAVSQHLAKLEATLGVALFDRAGNRLHLTAAGEALLPLALDLLDRAQRARDAVRVPAGLPQLTVAGVASAIATIVLPRLDRLRAIAELDLVDAEDDDALRELRLGHVDVVLTQEYAGVPAPRDPALHHVEVASDRLRLVLPPDLPATTRLADIGGRRWLSNGIGTRCTLAAARRLAADGIDPPSSGTIVDNATLLALVAAGHGVAIVPELVIGGRTDVTVARQDLGISRTILAVTRTPTPATAALVDALRTAARRRVARE